MSTCVSHIAGERHVGPLIKANSRYKDFVFDKKYLCDVFLRSVVGNPIPFCIAFAPACRVIEPPGRSAAQPAWLASAARCNAACVNGVSTGSAQGKAETAGIASEISVTGWRS